MGLSGPRPAARSRCGRKSPQGSRAAVVTVYLAANTTRSLDVFDQEEPPSAAVWGPSTRLGAESAFVEFVETGLTRARSPINRRKQKKWLLSQANM
jgi:hypothetical protein